MEEEKLDYLNNMSRAETEDSLKDLMRDHYTLFMPYLGELFHVEANCIYLNIICGVSQAKIGAAMNISQYGVSKRVRGGLNKLTHLLKIPEKDKKIVREDFDQLIASNKSEVLFLYYFLRTFALTSRVLEIDPNIVNSMVLSSMDKLKNYSNCNDVKEFIKCYLDAHEIKVKSFKELKVKYPDNFKVLNELREDKSLFELMKLKAVRYHTYLEGIIDNSSYGDYTFKLFDKERAKQ